MTRFIWPCSATFVSDSYWDHRNRRPPSTNPGTDIACGYGSEVWAVASGTIAAITNDTNSAAGRYLTIALDEGGYIDQKLHLSRILVSRGQRVEQGEVVALSGASGFGSEWGYGPHLHQTFRENGVNVDFEQYASPSSATGGGSTPIPKEWDEMASRDEIKAASKEALAELLPDIRSGTKDEVAALLRGRSDAGVVALDIEAPDGGHHFAILSSKTFRHLLRSDDPDRIRNILTASDSWVQTTTDELRKLLHTFGCDTNAFRLEPKSTGGPLMQLTVLDPLDNTYKPGGVWTAENVIRAAQTPASSN